MYLCWSDCRLSDNICTGLPRPQKSGGLDGDYVKSDMGELCVPRYIDSDLNSGSCYRGDPHSVIYLVFYVVLVPRNGSQVFGLGCVSGSHGICVDAGATGSNQGRAEVDGVLVCVEGDVQAWKIWGWVRTARWRRRSAAMRWGMKNVRIIIGRLKYGWGWSLELLGRVSGWYSGKIKGWVGYWRE